MPQSNFSPIRKSLISNGASKTLALCLGVLAAAFSMGYLVFGSFQEPTISPPPPTSPPGVNVLAPVNEGTTSQFKLGDLGVSSTFSAWGGLSADTLVVANGRVGIGVANPANALEVKGKFFLTQDICLANGICLSSCTPTGCSGYCTEYKTDLGCVPKAVGEYGLPVCSGCLGGFVPQYYPNGQGDYIGSEKCGSGAAPLTHYRCDGAGNCTAPGGISVCVWATFAAHNGMTCNQICDLNPSIYKSCLTGFASSTNCGINFLAGGYEMGCNQIVGFGQWNTTKDTCLCQRWRYL